MEAIGTAARLVQFLLMLGTAVVFMRMTGAFAETRNQLWAKILIALSPDSCFEYCHFQW